MKRILVVDDDLHIGNLLEEVLGKAGYGVSRAYSGTEALLCLESAPPDLVLLDLMLPGLSGEELLPKIEGVPVIVLSAKAGLDSKVARQTILPSPLRPRSCWPGWRSSFGAGPGGRPAACDMGAWFWIWTPILPQPRQGKPI